MDRDNLIREALETDGQLCGARAKNRSPMMVEVYGELGLDFVWLDFEDDGSPYQACKYQELARAGQVADIEPLVRLPTGEPSLIRRALDSGIQSILIPRVETAAEVRRAVEASRFDYDGSAGERGISSGRASNWGASFEGYAEREDDQVLVGAMIENMNAVENLDDILSVPDLGFAFIGPSDLSVSLEHPLEKDHPDVVETVEQIKETCMSRGVPVGCIETNKPDIEQALDEGYQLVRIGDEIESVRTSISQRLGR